MSTGMKAILCGLGNMGTHHFRVLRETPGVEVTSVVDPDPSRAERLFQKFGQKDCKHFTDLEQALAAGRPDVVFVVAPTAFHFELCKQVLERGIPLFVEKPIARTSVEGEALCKLALVRQVPFMVGHIERFNPAVAKAHELIRAGDLGEVISISTKRVGGTPRDIRGASDVLIDLAVHDIDIVHWLLGAAPALVGCSGHYGRAIDSATLLLQVGAAAVDMQVNWVTPVKIRELQITGTKAHLEVNLITQKLIWTNQNPELTGYNPNKELPFDQFVTVFGSPDRFEISSPPQEPLKAEILAFVSAVQNRQFVPVSAVDGLTALKVAEQARSQVEALPLVSRSKLA